MHKPRTMWYRSIYNLITCGDDVVHELSRHSCKLPAHALTALPLDHAVWRRSESVCSWTRSNCCKGVEYDRCELESQCPFALQRTEKGWDCCRDRRPPEVSSLNGLFFSYVSGSKSLEDSNLKPFQCVGRQIGIHFVTVIHFYFGSVQFSVKWKFVVSVRRKFRWRLAVGWAGPTTTDCCKILVDIKLR